MILPIVAYGDPVLKKVAKDIDQDYPNLKKLIEDMFKTMYQANGVGLAAPQIGKSIRLFVIDSSPMWEESEKEPLEEPFKGVLINAKITEESGDPWHYTEGCLSIPNIREDVRRLPEINISFYDENFKFQERRFTSLNARVIQHEYDHIEGILFTDHLKPLKRRLLKSKLDRISKGETKADYKMKFPARR